MKIQEIQQKILSRYEKEGRHFPWRETKDPYKIHLCEVMSQQTQLSRVVVYRTKWLEKFNRFEKLVLMFQKEVADRLYAKPGTKSYGRLSVLTQWKSEVEKMFDLEPGCFTPPPKIRSTVVRFTPKETSEDFGFFSAVLKDAFLHRRKLLANTLRKYSENIEEILQNLGYSKTVRAEEISVEDFRKLTSAFRLNN